MDKNISKEPQKLYPTMDSLQEVKNFAESRLPINTPNELHSLLMLYHNTFLQVLKPQFAIPLPTKETTHD